MPAGSKRPSIVLTALAGASLAAVAAVAGEDPINQNGGPMFTPPPIVTPEPPPVIGTPATGVSPVSATQVSAQATTAITQQLTAARDFCGRITDADYVVDCLASEVEVLASQMADRGDYAPARAELEQASRSLAQLAEANRNTSKPAARARRAGTQPRTSARELTPTRSESLGSVLEQAAGILEEVETTLLRASQRAEERRVHFERIAEAVGSNKVLLRSL